MAFSAKPAWDHIDRLAAEHGITVKLCGKILDAEAFIAAKVVLVPRRMTPVTYLVALHELGHIASAISRRSHYEWVRGCQQGAVWNDEVAMACEAAAWGWAWGHVDKTVLPRITQKTTDRVMQMLATHLNDPV